MKIAVVGTGYVGLVTGTCLADSGNEVTCIDIDREKIERLERRRDPDLRAGAGRVGRAESRGRSGCGSRPIWAPAVRPAGWCFWQSARRRPPTARPISRACGRSSSRSRRICAEDAIVVTKSTVPVGTNARIAARLKELTGRECDVASNPEFLEGRGGDRRLHEARPRRGRRAAAASGGSAARTSMPRFCGPKSRFWSCRPKVRR